MANIFLRKKISSRIADGHPWIYGNEIGDTSGNFSAGDIVSVFSSSGSFIGKGFINPTSQIRIRLLTRNIAETIDEAFVHNLIQKAWTLRQRSGFVENCRVVFSEVDGLPGLTIDKFDDYFVVQMTTLGMDQRKDWIVNSINDIFQPKGIYERNDIPVRSLEGLNEIKGYLSTPFDTKIQINENGLKLWVDIENGQKTGYYLDQSRNRNLITQFVKDKHVLDVGCYTGSFALLAASHKAKSVIGIDISDTAIQLANENAVLNKLENICQFSTLNAFDCLKSWYQEGKRFDMIILDPPAFTNHQSNISKALIAYKELNLRAMKLLSNDGILITSSISSMIDNEQFESILISAAKDLKLNITQLNIQGQPADHPINYQMSNLKYLKFYILAISK